MKSAQNTDKYIELFDLCKVPDDVIIKELTKELKQKDFEIGQLKSYIQELEDGLIERVYLNENTCSKCEERQKHLKGLEAKQVELKKRLEEFESLEIDDIENIRLIKDEYYKELEKNKRLENQLIKQAKEIFRLKESITP